MEGPLLLGPSYYSSAVPVAWELLDGICLFHLRRPTEGLATVIRSTLGKFTTPSSTSGDPLIGHQIGCVTS